MSESAGSKVLFLFLAIALNAISQPTSSIQFYDSTGTNTTATFGWSGDAASGNFYIETPNDGEPVKVKGGNVTVDGSVTAASFAGDGSALTNVSASSTIADGSITAAKLADSAVTTAKIANASVTAAKLADGSVAAAKLAAGVIPDSIAWTNIKGMPAGFADGVDNEGTGGATIADGSVTTAKIADGAVTDAKIDSMSWGKIKSNPLYVDGESNIGIGTTSPNLYGMTSGHQVVTISAQGSEKISVLELSGNRSANENNVAWIDFCQTNTAISCLKAINTTASTTEGQMLFYTKGTSLEERMRIDESGNVGIGTLNPGCRLTVNGSSNITLTSGPYQGNGGNSLINISNDDPTAGNFRGIMFAGAGGAYLGSILMQYEDQTNHWSNMKFATRNGDFWDTKMTLDKAGNLSLEGALSATSCCAPSDIRYKKDINQLENCLAKVSQLQGVSYCWKKHKSRHFPQEKQIGLIAQDVEKVVPEVVHTDREGYKSLSYDKLSVLLIEAVKEQQSIIDNLKQENSSLRKEMSSQMASFSKRLAALEGHARVE